MADDSSAGGGIGIGVIVAGVLSWFTHGSILWVIINALFGWLYVIYWMIFYWRGGWFTGW